MAVTWIVAVPAATPVTDTTEPATLTVAFDVCFDDAEYVVTVPANAEDTSTWIVLPTNTHVSSNSPSLVGAVTCAPIGTLTAPTKTLITTENATKVANLRETPPPW